MNLLDISNYPDVDHEYTLEKIQVEARLVNKGDILGAREVGDVKTGTKWTDITDTAGSRIKRVPLDETLYVGRRKATKESREASHRADRNQRLCNATIAWTPSTPVAMRKMQEFYEQYENVNYDKIGSLLSAQAADKVWYQWKSTVDWLSKDESEFTGDLVDAKEKFNEELRKQLSSGFKYGNAISRSTNQVANLMEDCDRAAIAEWLEKPSYFW